MIEVEHLTKRYGDHTAVDDLSFRAEPGKIYGFLGPNGAGKSTTMNIMTGYLSATSGTVTVDGHDIQKEPEIVKKNMGYLPEQPPVYPDMTVREYLQFAAELKKVPADKRKEAVEASMERMDLTDMQNRLIKNLSKGYRQRVGMAQATINDPQIVILDEPTVGLDPEQQREIFEYIRGLRENHIVILSSHILHDVSQICDFIWIINNGKLVASDTPVNLESSMTQQQTVRVTVQGTDPDALSAALADAVEDAQIQVEAGEAEDTLTASITSSNGEDMRKAVSDAVFGAGMSLLALNQDSKSLEDVFLQLTQDDDSTAEEESAEEAETGSDEETAEEAQEETAEETAEEAQEETAEGAEEGSEEETEEDKKA
jgi:ABC-2 type transport system ATP-binding protein